MFEGAAGELRARLLSIGARGRNVLVGGRPQVLWEGLAELRADTPSKARGAEGERGRPPPSSNTQCPITPGTRQARPTKIVTFPRDKAEKSPQNQHVLSILQVGSHQLQYRFFRTKKPKSHHKTNTFCPLTLLSRIGYVAIRMLVTYPHARNLSARRSASGQIKIRHPQSDVGVWWS